MATIIATTKAVYDPSRWGLSADVVADLGQRLYQFWLRYRELFRSRTRDTSENAHLYLRAQLTMETERNFANMVANSRDIMAPQEESPASSERRVRTWSKYTSGDAPGASQGTAAPESTDTKPKAGKK